jgi:Fe2+ or Zn2+ uptake regulation protein
MSSYIRLTAVQEKLLEVLETRPSEWFTTSEIADVFGVKPNAFSTHYRNALSDLVQMGIVESEAIRGIVMKSYRYRIVK